MPMKIKIYQINLIRDEKQIAFFGLERLPKFQGTAEVNSSLYDSVYVGDVDCKNLEEVYRKFNFDHPVGYRGRSLSVSDVVEIIESDSMKSGFYFCDSFGFREVPFEPEKTQISERFCNAEKMKTISVLLVQPNKYPKMIEIEDSLEAMQSVVGGDIEEYMPFEDEVAVICNEEGKINGLPLNRAIYAEDKEMIDIIAGDFFIAYAPVSSEKFLSLPDDMAKKYSEKFHSPERFYKGADGIKAVPFTPISKDKER